MYNDPELNAMSHVYENLRGLRPDEVTRILQWVNSKLGIEPTAEIPVPASLPQPQTPPPATATQQAAPNAPVQAAPPAVVVVQPAAPEEQIEPMTEPEVEMEEEAEESSEAADVNPAPRLQAAAVANEPPRRLGLKRFKSIENLFLASDVETVPHRIVLAAAYLQEKLNYKEVSSYDINSRLKRLGYGVANITNAINSLLNKKVPLMEQTKKDGDTKQAKRKFVVSEEGLKVAKTLLRGAGD